MIYPTPLHADMSLTINGIIRSAVLKIQLCSHPKKPSRFVVLAEDGSVRLLNQYLGQTLVIAMPPFHDHGLVTDAIYHHENGTRYSGIISILNSPNISLEKIYAFTSTGDTISYDAIYNPCRVIKTNRTQGKSWCSNNGVSLLISIYRMQYLYGNWTVQQWGILQGSIGKGRKGRRRRRLALDLCGNRWRTIAYSEQDWSHLEHDSTGNGNGFTAKFNRANLYG